MIYIYIHMYIYIYTEGGVRRGGEYAYCRNARFLHSLLQSLLSAAEMLKITI